MYMNDLFAPDAPTFERGVSASRSFTERRAANDRDVPAREEVSDELDFDRRAPLAMRIETAPDEPPARLPSPPPPGSPAGASRAAKPAATAPSPGSRSVPETAPAPSSGPQIPGWIWLAAFIVAGIATMVIVTLK
jgi:hypothetical protein